MPASRRWSAATSTAAGQCPAARVRGHGSAIATTAWCWRPSSCAAAASSGSSTHADGWPLQRRSHRRRRRRRVPVEMLLDVRFGFDADIPLIEMTRGGRRFLAGPDALILRGPLTLQQQGPRVSAELQVRKGDHIPCSSAGIRRTSNRPRGWTCRRRWRRPIRSGGTGPALIVPGLARRRGALAADAQGHDLCAHGRHRGRADGVAARVVGGVRNWTIATAGCATPA